jgi:hypothetical protein
MVEFEDPQCTTREPENPNRTLFTGWATRRAQVHRNIVRAQPPPVRPMALNSVVRVHRISFRSVSQAGGQRACVVLWRTSVLGEPSPNASGDPTDDCSHCRSGTREDDATNGRPILDPFETLVAPFFETASGGSAVRGSA